jgi:hypothetical protein
MPKLSISEVFLRVLTELRDEQRATRTDQVRVNIRAYVNRLVTDLHAEFTDSQGTSGLAPVRAKPLPSSLRQHGGR